MLESGKRYGKKKAEKGLEGFWEWRGVIISTGTLGRSLNTRGMSGGGCAKALRQECTWSVGGIARRQGGWRGVRVDQGLNHTSKFSEAILRILEGFQWRSDIIQFTLEKMTSASCLSSIPFHSDSPHPAVPSFSDLVGIIFAESL